MVNVIEIAIGFLFPKQIKHLTSLLSTSECLEVHELEKRRSHNVKERRRRNELRQSFVALKKALNIEEQVKMGNHDILNQVRNIQNNVMGLNLIIY